MSMNRPTHRLTVATLMVLGATVAAACGGSPPPSGSPSSPAAEHDATWVIDGRSLTSEDLNFRLTAPEGWSWEEDRPARQPADQRYVFIARLDQRNFFRVMVRARNLYENSERSIAEFLDGTKSGSAKSGMTMVHAGYGQRITQAGAGYDYSYDLQFPAGVAHVDGYLLAADRLYNLQSTSAHREHLEEFRRFVDSFELIEAPAQGR